VFQITGIVLAAGEGRRAGGVKALLELGGRTFLDRVVTAVRGAGCEPVIVVGGADSARVEAEARRLGAGFVLNEQWRDGQFSSLKAGAGSVRTLGTTSAFGTADARSLGTTSAQALENTDSRALGTADAPSVGAAGPRPPGTAALVALVDHPEVRSETCRTLVDAFRESPDRIVIPVCEDRRTGRLTRGHPVVLPPEVLAEVAVAPDGATLRDIIHARAGLIVEVRVEDPGVLKDVDTAADLKELGAPEG
jgi:nicotine blue oxidoreductase